MHEQEQGKALIKHARHAITSQLKAAPAVADTSTWLQQTGATFVTLTQNGDLRGCIGSLEAYRPLLEDVRANAVAAAFRDPRFIPLTEAELEITQVEVSLLSPQEPMSFTDEQDALAQLRPGVDGIVLEYGRYRSTFLPQVWEQLPTPQQFMAYLKRKAGLPEQFWANEVRLARYTVTKWKEHA
jgi:hypothetical protein